MREIGKVLTVEEADHRISTVKKIIDKIREKKSKLEYYRPDLPKEEKRRIVKRKSVDSDSTKRQIEFSDAIKELIDQGGILKDLEEGLVDFRWRHKGEKAYLCWKYGEEAILYWHGLKDGCSERQPL